VNPAEKRAMQARVGACHETLHEQLKNWGILSQFSRHHNISLLGDVIRACVVVTQLNVENGEPLFAVECDD